MCLHLIYGRDAECELCYMLYVVVEDVKKKEKKKQTPSYRLFSL